MKKFIVLIFLTAVTTVTTLAEVHNINLTPGLKKVLKNSVKAGDYNEQLYIFEAKENQALTVKINSTGNNAVFSVNEQYRVDHSPIEIDGNPVEEISDEWHGTLPGGESNGLYSVAVTATKGIARFTLEITLEDGDEAVETNMDTEGPQTAEQFYLLMPKKYDGKSEAERKEAAETARITEETTYTNYLRASLRGGTVELFEAAIFEKTGGGFVFVYNEDYDEDKNPSPTKLIVLDYENGNWTDVTAQLLPLPVNKKYQYALPSEGNTIEVTKDGVEKAYSLVWNNGKFIKQ